MWRLGSVFRGHCCPSGLTFRHCSGGNGSAARVVKIYNSQTRQLEPLVAADGNCLKWYNCGPTVYDSAHLGHARTYVCMDMIHRILTNFFSYDVFNVMGVTDIDDKIVARAIENNESVQSLASRCEADFMADMGSLGVQTPALLARVSEHIPDIIVYIERLQNDGFAYEATDGVYFDVKAFETSSAVARTNVPSPACCFGGYGAGLGPSAVIEAAASADPPPGKRDARDFALWKRTEHGASVGGVWDSPFGLGRPGWHIECSAMSLAALGEKFDMHGGGVDLQFPHHTNELAQSEAYLLRDSSDATATRESSSNDDSADPWVGVWIHTGHLHIAGLKMSKSLKNFISVRDLLDRSLSEGKGHAANAAAVGGARNRMADIFRTFCAQHHYRSNVQFSEDRLEEAAAFLRRMDDTMRAIHRAEQRATSASSQRWTGADRLLHDEIRRSSASVRHALAHDFDTPAALEALSALARSVHVRLVIADDAGGECAEDAENVPVPLLRAARSELQRILLRTLYIGGSYRGIVSSSSSDSSSSSSSSPSHGGTATRDHEIVDSSSSSSLMAGARAGIAGMPDEGERWDCSAATATLLEFRAAVRAAALPEDTRVHESTDHGAAAVLTVCDALRDRVLGRADVACADTRADQARLVGKWDARCAEASAGMTVESASGTSKEKKGRREPNVSSPGLVQRLRAEFGEFDDSGVPTHHKDGAEVSKSMRKKLRKKIEKMHKKFGAPPGLAPGT